MQYFNNKSIMMISRANHGESVNWGTIMYFQLVKELTIWDKCQKNMIEGTTKREPKKNVCHSWCTPKFLDRFNYESKVKTSEG
jgi:3-dehydroquinate synthetase